MLRLRIASPRSVSAARIFKSTAFKSCSPSPLPCWKCLIQALRMPESPIVPQLVARRFMSATQRSYWPRPYPARSNHQEQAGLGHFMSAPIEFDSCGRFLLHSLVAEKHIVYGLRVTSIGGERVRVRRWDVNRCAFIPFHSTVALFATPSLVETRAHTSGLHIPQVPSTSQTNRGKRTGI
jgi:hypothetical protein